MPNIHQVYIFRSLAYKHYHCDRDALLLAVKKIKLPIKVHVYPPTSNIDLHFVKVINGKFDSYSKALIKSIPWKEMASLVHKDTIVASSEIPRKKKKAPSKKAVAMKRQQYHKDFDFTSGTCLIGKDSLGVSCPVLKPSTDQHHVQAMVALSALLKHHIFDNLVEDVYFDRVNITRRQDFAQKIHPDNVLEALRTALSNVLHPCGCHDDSNNDIHSSFLPVITFSTSRNPI
jgi:hypothetical protein